MLRGLLRASPASEPVIRIRRLARTSILIVSVVLLTVMVVRVWQSERGPPLHLWHTYSPPELRAPEIAKADWAAYMAAEQAALDGVRARVTRRLPEEDRVAVNRYFEDSPLNPEHLARDWNRSYILEPGGDPVGAVVLLHGLTDGPFSARHLALHYRDHGFVAVVIRLPGHGTVPGGLAHVDWEDWVAATQLAIREARRRVGPAKALHLVGYSNGGALAMKYALEALADNTLPRPDRIVLISPMIGVTAFARFAGVLGWPAIFPSFAKTAWLDITPEFNPFKYNSFPVNAARQSSLVSRGLQDEIARSAAAGRLARLPPILTFQSVVDSTVSTQAVVGALYSKLPANGSELVLFDLNRFAHYGPLLRSDRETLLERLLPPAPRNYATSIITNADVTSREVVERRLNAGATIDQVRPLGLAYPPEVFSLSHIALPFPIDDGLYGLRPDPRDDFGLNLGALATRGERGTLVVSLDVLNRISSNPFFPYVLQRLDETITASPAPRH